MAAEQRGMKPEAWILSNCRFAADFHGPLPKGSYSYEKGNPYADLTGDKVAFDPQAGRLTFDLPYGLFRIQLTPEQAETFHRRLETDLRKEHLEYSFGEEDIQAVAERIVKDRLPEVKVWDYSWDGNGIEIHDGRYKVLLKVGVEELASKYGLVMPSLLDIQTPPTKKPDAEA